MEETLQQQADPGAGAFMQSPVDPHAVVQLDDQLAGDGRRSEGHQPQGARARGRLWRVLLKASPNRLAGNGEKLLKWGSSSWPVTTGTFMTPMQLDPQRLLGFRLEAREAVSLDGNGVKTAVKRGVKTGAKPGGKIGTKAGVKLGLKQTLSV